MYQYFNVQCFNVSASTSVLQRQCFNVPVLQHTSTTTDQYFNRPAYQSTAYQSTSASLIASLLHVFFNSAASGSQLQDLGSLSGRS